MVEQPLSETSYTIAKTSAIVFSLGFVLSQASSAKVQQVFEAQSARHAWEECASLALHHTPNSEHTRQRRHRQRKRQLKKNLGNSDCFVIIASSSHPLLLTEHAANGLVEAPLKEI